MQTGLLFLQVTSGGLTPNTLSQSHTSGQQDGVAMPKVNGLVSISETDVTQANPGKQPPVSIIRICIMMITNSNNNIIIINYNNDASQLMTS